jgi:hypothetical protein
MLDRFLNRMATWSSLRLWTYLLLSFLIAAELTSLFGGQATTCIINPDDYGEYYAHNDKCPAFHVFFFKTCSSVLEAIGEKWLVAIATIATALFTGTLWWSTYGLLSSTNESIRLARKEFISSHRPRMRLKHIWFTDNRPSLRDDNTTWQNGPLEVTLDIVNIGNTEGYITWINFESVLCPNGQRLPQRPPYDEVPVGPDTRTTRFPNNVPIGPGLTYARQVCDGRILDPVEVQDILVDNLWLYLIGTIEYFDFIPDPQNRRADLGGLRQTAFCRRLTFTAYPPPIDDAGRLDKQNDPDYEFEEWGD